MNYMPEDRESYDSEDEWAFSLWCRDAVEAGILYKWGYHPTSFEIFPKATVTETVQLKTKTKEVERHLLHPLTYTTDFVLLFTSVHWRDMLGMRTSSGFAFVDVKGDFSKFHDDKSFSMIQKMMYHLKGVYINKVKVKDVFMKTFVPESVRIGRSGKCLRKWEKCPRFPGRHAEDGE